MLLFKHVISEPESVAYEIGLFLGTFLLLNTEGRINTKMLEGFETRGVPEIIMEFENKYVLKSSEIKKDKNLPNSYQNTFKTERSRQEKWGIQDIQN